MKATRPEGLGLTGDGAGCLALAAVGRPPARRDPRRRPARAGRRPSAAAGRRSRPSAPERRAACWSPRARATPRACASSAKPLPTRASRSRWFPGRGWTRSACGNHQGVAALVRSRPGGDLDERSMAGFPFEPDAVVVVLDGVTDPQNLGAAARAAEAAGAAMLVTRRHRAAPPSASAVRASAGALLHLPVARVANITRAIERLQGRGFHVVGLDQDATIGIHDGPPPPRPVALVTGCGGRGAVASGAGGLRRAGGDPAPGANGVAQRRGRAGGRAVRLRAAAAMTAFEDSVRRVVSSLGPGDVVTYGEVAIEAGHPGAARAVGGVMASSDGLPWWRVRDVPGAPGPRPRGRAGPAPRRGGRAGARAPRGGLPRGPRPPPAAGYHARTLAWRSPVAQAICNR